MTQPLWTPSPEFKASCQLQLFINYVNKNLSLSLQNYDELYTWSIEDSEHFWKACWHFFNIKHSAPPQSILEPTEHMITSQWFKGAKLNFAENLLSRRDDKLAIIFVDEKNHRRTLTYAQLHQEVARVSAGLKGLGVTAGDRVVGLMPHMPETITAMLAATSLGAIWSACSPDFGEAGIIDRFEQITPKVLFASNGQYYKQKFHNNQQKIDGILKAIPSITHCLMVPYHTDDEIDDTRNGRITSYQQLPQTQEPLTFEQLPFDHPLYILYSSGTTGKPKCIVHGAGGTLLQHLKELVLHSNLEEHERIFFFTTCSWMMWHWLITSLAQGATLVLYDGCPTEPEPARLFQLIEKENIHIFGTSASYLNSTHKLGIRPNREFNLKSLKSILTTGSPLLPETFDYIYQDVKKDVQLSSISGGTDIISCFALGNPMRSVHRGELQGRGLGMAVDVYDDEGQPIRQKQGELVCTQPFPSMPVGFWNDTKRSQYFNAYFSRFENVWHHSDFAEITANDGIIIYGRSDTTLNPKGVRIGTSEIYAHTQSIPEVIDCSAVDQKWQDDTRIILFVQLKPGITLDDSLRKKIKETIRQNTTPRHVPSKIVQVTALPKTMNGKTVERVIRQAIHGEDILNTQTLLNPEILEQFQNLAELQTS